MTTARAADDAALSLPVLLPPFYTVGHSDRPLDVFVSLLVDNRVGWLADIRKMPGSRTNPQFNGDTLAAALAAVDIGYVHIAALGGMRTKARDVAPDLNAWWTNRSFHHYADYALGPEFRAGLDELMALGMTRAVAIMCAEAVWWRCHRRFVTDYLLAHGRAVYHLMGPGRAEPARMTPDAVVRPDLTIVYPAAG